MCYAIKIVPVLKRSYDLFDIGRKIAKTIYTICVIAVATIGHIIGIIEEDEELTGEDDDETIAIR